MSDVQHEIKLFLEMHPSNRVNEGGFSCSPNGLERTVSNKRGPRLCWGRFSGHQQVDSMLYLLTQGSYVHRVDTKSE